MVYLVEDGRVGASFALADTVRPESKQAVQRLRQAGIEVAMLTGDSRAVADTVAGELGIGAYFAEVLPEHKDRKVAELQGQGKRVAMVGDGVNDAPALTRADIGIAIGSGTDVAVESADIILVNSNPVDVVKIVALSRATYRKMLQNLVWATGYNVVALPLAADVQAPDRIRGVLTVTLGAFFSMEVQRVVIGDMTYSTNLQTGKWEVGPGLASALPSPMELARPGPVVLGDVVLEGAETLGGVAVYHVRGAPPLGDFGGQGDGVQVDVWVGVEDSLIWQIAGEGEVSLAALGGTLGAIGLPERAIIAMTLTFSGYGEPVEIEAPAIE